MENAIKIYNYTDYRTFLKDHFQQKKRLRPQFSLGAWSKTLGLSSTAVLVNILNGNRNAGDTICVKFVDYFAFDIKEKQYFEDLVSLAKCTRDPRVSLALMEKMGRVHPDGTFKLLDDRTFSAISKWHYYVLKEMVAFTHFEEDPDWIVSQLEYPVSAKEVKKAIQDLIALEVLMRNDKGKLQLQVKNLKTSTDISSEAIKRFHEQALENGKVSIRKHELHERDFSSRTLSIKEESIPQLKQYIKEFRDKVSELFDENAQSSRVYQLNVQLIPMTKKQENSNDN